MGGKMTTALLIVGAAIMIAAVFLMPTKPQEDARDIDINKILAKISAIDNNLTTALQRLAAVQDKMAALQADLSQTKQVCDQGYLKSDAAFKQADTAYQIAHQALTKEPKLSAPQVVKIQVEPIKIESQSRHFKLAKKPTPLSDRAGVTEAAQLPKGKKNEPR